MEITVGQIGCMILSPQRYLSLLEKKCSVTDINMNLVLACPFLRERRNQKMSSAEKQCPSCGTYSVAVITRDFDVNVPETQV